MAQAAQGTKYIVSAHQVRSPTLLIGVGGIGGQIVRGVYDAMSEYDRSRVEMLVMDTNINDLDNFIGTGIRYIQTSENKTVQGYLEANSSYVDWFPVNPLINAKNLSQGAGQIRSVSRLGALASKAEGRFSAIDDAIDRLLTNHGDTLERAARVMVVGSATGGTGSGLGVQLPFYVRNVLENKNVPNVLIRGLFLMPSLTEGVQDTEAKKKAVNVNGYAFLKEVNAFYRAQTKTAEDNILSVEEYVPGVRTLSDGGKKLASAAPVPYDFLFLVEKYGDRGSIGTLEDYIARSAQMVINQLFSPVAARGFSAEDNLITSSVPTGGMNRYCGAGIANAIYPKDEVVRYCTVRYAGEMIKGYWLQIDDEFNRKDEQQRRLKKTNPNMESLDPGDTYCQIFDDMCDPKKHDVSSDLAALKRELTVRVTSGETGSDGSEPITEDRPLVDCMVEYINGHINEVFANSGLAAEAESCNMDRADLKYPDDAGSEVTDKMGRLSRFRTNADAKVSSLVVSTAEEILPSDLKLAQGVSKDAKHNIYVALCKKHPIIARYVLYALRKRLRVKKQESDERLEDRFGRESIFTKDYYKDKKGDNRRESPREALDRTPAGLLSGIGLNSAAYTKLIKTIAEDASAEAGHILEMAEHSLKSTAYRIVLERMDALIELYELFFEELRDIMEKKGEEAKRLEAGKGSDMDKDYKGDKYICCNAQCKQVLYAQFQSSVTEAELEMSETVKHGFFDQMFGEYVARLAEKANPTAYVSHLSLSQLFEQGILEPITAQFQKKGFRHLDMSILEAIEKQFKIEKHLGDEEAKKPEQRVAFQQYFADLCSGLRTLAVPYLSYDLEVAGYNSGGKLNYTWGLNHSAVARYQNGSVEQGVDAQKLKDMFGSNETTLADDSFTPYQLVCYAAIYDLRVENCKMYRKRSGDCAQKFYQERLENLVDQAYVINDEQDGYLEVIHPHLDCRWHEHAYLPELMGNDDEKQCKDTRLSFMFAVCLKRCEHVHEKTESLTSWRYRRMGAKRSSPVYVDGRELRAASKFALYNAFDRNRVIVQDTQDYIALEREKIKNDRSATGVTDEVVLNQPLMQALLGKLVDGAKVTDGQNVLDLLYELLLDSGRGSILDPLLADLERFIYEYCLEQVNNHNRATAMSETIRKAIGAASKSLADPDVSTIFKESCERFQ